MVINGKRCCIGWLCCCWISNAAQHVTAVTVDGASGAWAAAALLAVAAGKLQRSSCLRLFPQQDQPMHVVSRNHLVL